MVNNYLPRRSILVFVLNMMLVLLLSNNAVYGQFLLPAPRLYLVTVNPETGYDSITWFSIPAPPTDYYTVAVRVHPFSGQPGDIYMAITSNIQDTAYVNSISESASHSVGYTVWGVHTDGVSEELGRFNSPDSTLFLSSVPDLQNSTISIRWNDYNSWRGSIAIYNIYRRLGPYNYQLISSVPEGTNEYVIANIEVDQQYELFVEAVNIDGIRKSTSNRVNLSTTISQLPGYRDDVYNKSEIYPVPAGQVLHVKSNNSSDKIVRIDILNTNGEMIISDLAMTNGNDYFVSLDISMLPAGFYLCNLIYFNGTKQSLRFIK